MHLTNVSSWPLQGPVPLNVSCTYVTRCTQQLKEQDESHGPRFSQSGQGPWDSEHPVTSCLWPVLGGAINSTGKWLPLRVQLMACLV